MNWKIIIKPINVGWLSLNSKATNSSLRPIKTANNEKHKKEFICRKKKKSDSICTYSLLVKSNICYCDRIKDSTPG